MSGEDEESLISRNYTVFLLKDYSYKNSLGKFVNRLNMDIFISVSKI